MFFPPEPEFPNWDFTLTPPQMDIINEYPVTGLSLDVGEITLSNGVTEDIVVPAAIFSGSYQTQQLPEVTIRSTPVAEEFIIVSLASLTVRTREAHTAWKEKYGGIVPKKT